MKTLIMTLMAMVMVTGALYGQTPDQPPPVPSEEQPEVLTRGPVNEAFAQPVNLEEEKGFIVPEAPPPDIEEVLPAERPVGEHFAWIPGYWAWDSDRNEYIWISGCWRAVPPGKYWIPGYWTEVDDGWRWVAGFWASVSTEEIEYLPAPPEITYVEEPVRATYGKIWVPPCWYWSHGRYTLRAGYWIEAREDWVWVPSHYLWTPRGYVFVNGHWDYPLHRRGVLFAPVYFSGNIYKRARVSFSLSIVLDIGNLEFALFTRPGYNHYYFGDYYDSFYVGIGIFPWFECVTRHTWYDPIYLHDHWLHRNYKPGWQQRQWQEYARRRNDKKLRPPRTYREMERRERFLAKPLKKNFEVAVPMKRFVEKKKTTFKFQKHDPEAQKRVSRHTDEIRKHVGNRSQRESPVTVHKNLRSIKKPVPSEEHRVSNVKESRERNSETSSTKRRPVEKRSASPASRQKKPEAINQKSRNAANTPQYMREKNIGKTPAAARNTSRTEKKTIPQVERRVVQAQAAQKRPDLKSRERQRSLQRVPARSYEGQNRSQKRTVTSSSQVKSSTVSRPKKEKTGTGPVKVKSSPSVSKNKERSSSKKVQSKAVEEEKHKNTRSGMQRHLQ